MPRMSKEIKRLKRSSLFVGYVSQCRHFQNPAKVSDPRNHRENETVAVKHDIRW